MVKAMDCRIVVSEFVLQSRYYVHFRANTLAKGMNLPYPLSYGLNSTTTVLLGEWLLALITYKGARGVMVIVVGNGYSDTSSNPVRD